MEHANANPTQIPYLQNLRTIRCLSNKALVLNDERFYERYDLPQNMKLVGNLPAIESLIGGRCPSDGSLAGIDKIDLLNALSFRTQTLRVLDLDVDDEFLDSPVLDRVD
ncbi:hypothetical protein PHISP_01604 [Aspergillus sp. HF37]|nr:hypothetical protein PHISP_01604 [Aspergillus sp. HF37]